MPALLQTDNPQALQATPPAPPTEGETGLRVEEATSRAAFVLLQDEWNALVGRTHDEPFYRHEFIRVWLDNFAPQAPLRVLLARDNEGRLVAVLPLIEERAKLFGVPVRALISAANDHTPRFDLIAEDEETASLAFMTYLRRDPSWELIRINNVPDGGSAWHLYGAAGALGHPTGAWESLNSPYIELPSTQAELAGRLDTKFKANLRRRRKKLEERGQVTVEKTEGGPDLPLHIEEGLALEQGGWKGRGGTAIAQSGATWGFYSELARAASYNKQLALYIMRVDGRPVAFHYALQHGGTYYLLKPAYDEAVKECSPGQLLMEEVVRRCIEEGFTRFDFLGPDMPWKRDWTALARPHTWLFIFRDTPYGRTLRDYKFSWAQGARRVTRRFRKP